MFIIIVSSIYSSCIYTSFQPSITDTQVHQEGGFEEIGNLNTQELSSNDIYTGIGAPWNLTHYANRTDYDLSVSFNETSSDSASIPLGSGWKGYQLDIVAKNLKDRRNWNRGTFSYGPDDGNESVLDDDTEYIANEFQNWVFGFNDTGHGNNSMSGNYLSNIGGHDCLELRMDDYITQIGGTPFSSYDPDDSCWWSSTITVPRGRVVDSQLNFDLYPNHLAQFNSWGFSIYLNNKRVYQIGTFSLLKFGLNNWHSFSIPQRLWSNKLNVFPSEPIINSDIEIQLVLECIGGGNYSDFLNDDYQRLYVDNVELVMECEALPSNLDLRANGTIIQDVGWGEGTISLNGDWPLENVFANFSTNDFGELGTYSVSFDADLNLFAEKNGPETSFEADTASLGTFFEVDNSSSVLWESYGYIAVPTGYVESQMIVRFPEDLVITSIVSSVEPAVNVLSQCDTSIAGKLVVPVGTITDTPDGFWKLNGESPNYCEGLVTYSDATGDWEENDVFLSDDSINVTAKITTNSIVADHIQNTQALLQIRFPNGTLWDEEKQFALVDINGYVSFNPIQIPSSPPNYEVGEYQVIVLWNNSHSGLGLNESGLIYKTFRVKHESSLTPEKDSFENVLEGTMLNVKVSFNDRENFDAIENAQLYTYNFTHPTVEHYFVETTPGSYLLEFNTIGGNAGLNTITIHANSSVYVNNEVNITIDLIKQTTLTIDSTFLQDVPYESNFSIQFNYTETYGGAGISADGLFTNWVGDHQFVSHGGGVYELICNASGGDIKPDNYYTLILDVQASKHIPQSIPISVLIGNLESRLELYVNGRRYDGNELVSLEVWETANITAKYLNSKNAHISGATVKLTIGSYTYSLEEDLSHQQYNYTLSASDIGVSLNYLTLVANKTDYNLKSVRVIFEITKWLTNLQIFINGANHTIDPSITIPIGTMVNVTIKYLDSRGTPIEGAILNLLGDYTCVLIEKDQQYSIIFNSTVLGVDTNIITVSAQKTDYQFQTDDLRVEVRKIDAEISLQSGDPRISIFPGEDVTLNIILTDEFDNRIIGAEVYYTWRGVSGTLTDPDNNGIYTVTLRNVPAGSYIIRINAFAGENYDFDVFEIAVSAIIPAENLVTYLFAIILTLAIGSALGIYYYLYRTKLRFPKQVRHVKKYRKTLNKAKEPRIAISNRDEAFTEAYQDEVSGANKLYKAKLQKPPKLADKLVEKQESKDSGDETNP